MKRDGSLFLTVEVGTSGARSAAFGDTGSLLDEYRVPYATRADHAGWAEQDADDWRSCALESLVGLCAHIDAARVRAIGLTGQTPTVVPVDARAQPLRMGMLYRDNRATAEAAELIALFDEEKIHEITGHTPSAFHVGAKILWLRRHEPDVFDRTRWFLQPRDVVLHALTGRIATDESHANSTALFDLRNRRWSADILDACGLDQARFPEALPPWCVAATISADVAAATGLDRSVPVVIGAGDSQCAAYGAGVVAPGPVSEMAGSSSCINTAVVEPTTDLRVTHYSHAVPGMYTTEVGLNTTGAAIRWAVHALGYRSFRKFEASAVEGRSRVAAASSRADAVEAAPFFLPHLGDGERTDAAAPAGLFRVSERHDMAAVAYAVIEGVAMAVEERVAILREAGCPTDELRAAGGCARIDVLGQAKADTLGTDVLHLKVDTSGMGAAMLAAEATGHADVSSRARAKAIARARRFELDGRFRPFALARLDTYRGLT